jgi:hypothetical protein
MSEPTGKKILLSNHMRGTTVTVYGSRLDADVSMSPESLIIGDYEVTDEDVRRGWIDLDEIEIGHD